MSPTTATSRRTTEPYIQESSDENGSLNSHDLEYDDYTIGMALSSSPVFTPGASRAIHFNKDTLHPDISVKSIHLHDTRQGLQDQVVEGEQGWVMQGVLSRATFRRSPVSGQKCITVLSLHISNIYAQKKGIAKKLILTLRAIMISQEVDLVAGDFNGTAWRCRSRNNLSTVDEAFTDCVLPTPPGPTPLWVTWIHSGQLGQTSVDFSSTPGSERFWKVSEHGAFSIPWKALGPETE